MPHTLLLLMAKSMFLILRIFGLMKNDGLSRFWKISIWGGGGEQSRGFLPHPKYVSFNGSAWSSLFYSDHSYNNDQISDIFICIVIYWILQAGIWTLFRGALSIFERGHGSIWLVAVFIQCGLGWICREFNWNSWPLHQSAFLENMQIFTLGMLDFWK